MNKRYQVFVSSTYTDLREERSEVIQALLELDCIPAGMELFPAGDDDQWTLIKSVIDECDYYVVIVGGRYGSLGAEGKSYTEMEYDYAQSRLPVMGFLHQNPDDIPSGKTESAADGKAALARFRSSIESRRHCKYWSSPENLGGVVSRAVANLIKTRPAVGWARANLLADESAAQEILRLRNRIAELEDQISAAGKDPPSGSEGLAQGNEKVSLRFHFEVQGPRFLDEAYELTWNEVLSALGPIMLDSASENELSEALSGVFRNRMLDLRQLKVWSVYLRAEDFHRVKIQLRALGLIMPAPAKMGRRWTLTPYGDSTMTRVAAIRSSAPAG